MLLQGTSKMLINNILTTVPSLKKMAKLIDNTFVKIII